MGTRGRVRKTNVSTTNIREVADIDYSIAQANTTGTELFTDNDLAGQYIDPTYCVGNDNTERLDTLTTKPYVVGEFRNYGGDEIPLDGVPEIYFSSIIGKGFGTDNPSEFIPQTSEDLQYIKDNNHILGVVVPPNLMEIDNYTSAAVIESKQLVDETQSAMFREGGDDVLNASDLGVQVGLDYLAPATKDPIFSYNITTYYGDIPISLTVKDPLTGTSTSKALLALPYLVGAPATLLGLKTVGGLEHLFDAWKLGLKPVLVKAGLAIDKFLTSAMSTVGGAILIPIALYTAMIAVADTIWDMAQSPRNVSDGIYQYKNLIDGMYTFKDISKSKYQIGFGSLFTGKDKFISKFILPDVDPNVYTSPVNITQFPQNEIYPDITRKKYANFKFFPKCNQYDLMTPPPVITYKIELEPIANCKLSTTKITSFVIGVAPDKYNAPIFDIKTPTGLATQGVQNIYKNTPISFLNAKWVDSIALLDRGKPAGLFSEYYNFYVNTDGGEGSYRNHYGAIVGNDIPMLGKDIFNNDGLYVDSSPYEVAFMQEKQGNIIKNPTFRLERQSEDPDNPTNLLRKFWSYGQDWQIKDGAIYRDSAGSSTTGFNQTLDNLFTGSLPFYFLDLDVVVNGGYLELNTAGIFDGGQYNWNKSQYGNDPFNRQVNPVLPDGCTIVNENFRFSVSRNYRLLLRVRPNSTSKILNFKNSEDFTGRVNYVSLQYLSAAKIYNDNKSSRGATNALTHYGQSKLNINWVDGWMVNKLIKLTCVTTSPNTPVNIKFTPKESEASVYTTTINWSDTYEDTITSQTHQEYSTDHIFANPGTYVVEVLNEIPQSDATNNFETLTCNSSSLVKYEDLNGLLLNGSVNLSGTQLGVNTEESSSLFMGTQSLSTPLSSLDVHNTPLTGNTDKLTSITGYLDISNTKVSGDLMNLYNIAYVNASNSDVSTCSSLDQIGGVDNNKTIIWKDSNIDVESLYNLINACDLSSIEYGHLDIKGSNPPIIDQDSLDQINTLINIKHWEVLYNTIDSADINLTTDTGVLFIGSFAPIVAISNNINISTATGVLNILGFSPSVFISNAKNFTTGTGELTITGFEPIVSAYNNINLNTGTGVLTFTGVPPSVFTSDNKTMVTGTGSIVMDGFQITMASSHTLTVNGGTIAP